MEVKLTKEEYESLLNYKDKVEKMERSELVIQSTNDSNFGEERLTLIGEKGLIRKIVDSTGGLLEMNARLHVSQQKQLDLEKEVAQLESN